MNILLPPIDTICISEGPICFDVLVDGVPVNCVLTEPALSAAAAVDHGISRREAFALGQTAIKEVVARRARESSIGPIVITQAEFSM